MARKSLLSVQTSDLSKTKIAQKSRESQKFKLEEETLPNPNFYWGTDNFVLENGDQYNGEYCCHKTGIIWREGKGIYQTKDGHIYEGNWENDQLLNSPESKLIFPSNDCYEGSVINGKYNGQGTYIFNDQLVLHAVFEDNKPIKDVTLVDYDGHLWQGEPDESYALLLPRNVFFETLPDWQGMGEEVIVTKEDELKNQVEEEEIQPSLEELEQKYFSKSTKTKNDFKFNKPRYCREKSCKKVQLMITDDLKDKQSSEVSISLLKMFLSRSWREKSKPIHVIAPTMDQENNKCKSVEISEPEAVSSEEELDNVIIQQ